MTIAAAQQNGSNYITNSGGWRQPTHLVCKHGLHLDNVGVPVQVHQLPAQLPGHGHGPGAGGHGLPLHGAQDRGGVALRVVVEHHLDGQGELGPGSVFRDIVTTATARTVNDSCATLSNGRTQLEVLEAPCVVLLGCGGIAVCHNQPGLAHSLLDLPANLIHLILFSDDSRPGGEANPKKSEEWGGVALAQKLVESFPPEIRRLRGRDSAEHAVEDRSPDRAEVEAAIRGVPGPGAQQPRRVLAAVAPRSAPAPA